MKHRLILALLLLVTILLSACGMNKNISLPPSAEPVPSAVADDTTNEPAILTYETDGLLYEYHDADGSLIVTVTDSTLSNVVTRVGWYKATEHATERAILGRLTSIQFGTGITTIDDSAFSDCYHLQAVEFPDTLESIGSLAFANCPMLTQNNIEGLTETVNIGWWAFYQYQPE